MVAAESIDENLKFLILEVESQVRLTFRLLNDADIDPLERITSKDDYVDNLPNTHRTCWIGWIFCASFTNAG